MKIQNDFNLISLNTFKLNSIARYFCEVTDESDLLEAAEFAKNKNTSMRFLGGGSNLILPEKIDALVIKNSLFGQRIITEDETTFIIECASGMNWHEFVMTSLSRGYYGLENLALIPGTVGGAPIQNIGAYGVEVNRFITRVHGYDFETHRNKSLSTDECKFEYRNSIFKTPEYKNFFITRVEFKLLKDPEPIVTYSELANVFAGQVANPIDIAQKVIEVRQKKLPDVNTIPNVGSFFKNPIVTTDKLNELKTKTPDLVSYPQPNGHHKLAAGQLIDKLGFKGQKQGAVGMYEKQALVMVNIGQGTRKDVESLADQIRTACMKTYGVVLETEPIFW